MRILIISYAFAPMNYIGAIRFSKLSKYLLKMGHKVAIISGKVGIREALDTTLMFDGFHGVPRLSCGEFSTRTTKWLHGLFFWLKKHEDNFFFRTLWGALAYFVGPGKFSWYFNTLKKALILAKEFKPDIIISTFDPIADHRLGMYLKGKLPNVKWVVDFRDPMYSNFFIEQCVNVLERFFVSRYDTSKLKLRNKFLLGADGVISVCDAWLKMQQDTYPNPSELQKKQFTLTNGFDQEDSESIVPTPLIKENLHIIYPGKLIGNRRDPTMLFNIINELIKDKKIPKDLVKIHYCGRQSKAFKDFAKDADISRLLIDHGMLSRQDAMNLQAGCDIMLLLTWNDVGYEQMLSAKIFEYMLIGKPIIGLISGELYNSHPKQVIEDLNLGIGCEYQDEDYKRLKAWFLAQVNCFQREGKIEYSPKNTDHYTHHYLAKELEAYLEKLLE